VSDNECIVEEGDSYIIKLSTPLDKIEGDSLADFADEDIRKEYMIHTYCLPNALPAIHVKKNLKEIKSIYDIPEKKVKEGLFGNKIITAGESKVHKHMHNKYRREDKPYTAQDECSNKLQKIDSMKLRIIRNFMKKKGRARTYDDSGNGMYKNKPNAVMACRSNIGIHGKEQASRVPSNLVIPIELRGELDLK
jgi:hypothetical protein